MRKVDFLVVWIFRPAALLDCVKRGARVERQGNIWWWCWWWHVWPKVEFSGPFLVFILFSFICGRYCPQTGTRTNSSHFFLFRFGDFASAFRTCVIVCRCIEGGRMYKRALVKVAASGGDNNRKSCVWTYRPRKCRTVTWTTQMRLGFETSAQVGGAERNTRPADEEKMWQISLVRWQVRFTCLLYCLPRPVYF